MGFLFTLKWSLVVKAPDLSSPKCLVVTDFFFFFKCSIFHYFFFFLLNLDIYFFRQQYTSILLASPARRGLNPVFCWGNHRRCFIIIIFFSSGFLGQDGGSRWMAAWGVIELNLGCCIILHPNARSTQHLLIHCPGAPKGAAAASGCPDTISGYSEKKKKCTFL